MTRMAAVSVGSNTVHSLIADVVDDNLSEVSRRALLPGLGAVVEKSGAIGPEKLTETVGYLTDLVQEARDVGCTEILCGATAAVRRATDREEFLRAAEAALGNPVHLISGLREAQLSFLGAAGTHAFAGRWLLADLGGGSTELVVAEGARGLTYTSLELGSAVLAARHLGDLPTGAERARVRRDAFKALGGAPDNQPRRLVVTGGTSSTAPRLLEPDRPPEILSRSALLGLADRLDSEPAASLSWRFEVPEARLRSMRAGVEILLVLLDWCGLDALHVSHQGVRHGMLMAHGQKGDRWWADDHQGG